ncbi:MAG: hypothetical protein ACTHM1_10655 [Solirubrobacteraceae bacterium]
MESLEGQLVHVEGDAIVWHINGGIRWGVPSQWLFDEIAPNRSPRSVSRAELEQYQQVPSDGCLLQERPTGRILIVVGGVLFWVSPEQYERLRLWKENVTVVHKALLALIPYGGLYSKCLDGHSHIVARLFHLREKHRLDQRAFVIGVLSGVVATLLIKAA